MKDRSDTRMPPISGSFQPRITSEYRSMESDGWDLHVFRTYAGIGRDGCEVSGVNLIAATLLYGAGLRLLECLELRIKDVDFGSERI